MEKKIPLRMCSVCKKMLPKKELIRVVKTNENKFFVDTSLKANGRGAYICKNPLCFEKCKKTRALNRAFKEPVPEEVYLEIENCFKGIKE